MSGPGNGNVIVIDFFGRAYDINVTRIMTILFTTINNDLMAVMNEFCMPYNFYYH